MTKRLVVRKNRYFDSVFLMQVAHQIAGQPGIRDASALMATEANKKLLFELGYATGSMAAELAAAAPNDLVIAIDGEAAVIEAVAADPDRWLTRGAGEAGSGGLAGGRREPRSLEEAMQTAPGASVAVVSVPGEHAAREARGALARGMNVFLFSSNVSVEDELALKTTAREKGLIVMGPDCGTAYLGGAGIGFANAVRCGPVGVVGPSGTGMQELACLVHNAGSGISQGIGTGSRDLSDAIGGISTLTAVESLDADPRTAVIALISKPPGARTLQLLMGRLGTCRKPVIACFFGAADVQERDAGRAATPAHFAAAPPGPVRFAATLDDAARLCLEAIGARVPSSLRPDPAGLKSIAEKERTRFAPSQRFVRGVFAGGTFCFQSQGIFREAGIAVFSNSPLAGMRELQDPRESSEHSLVDMGAEIFVEGRPHPMIDSSARRERVRKEGRDPQVAILLLDFILGAISSRDPVGDMREAITSARQAARDRGGHLCVAASVCGTDEDLQDKKRQLRLLEETGALVFPSNAQAALFARELALMLPKG